MWLSSRGGKMAIYFHSVWERLRVCNKVNPDTFTNLSCSRKGYFMLHVSTYTHTVADGCRGSSPVSQSAGICGRSVVLMHACSYHLCVDLRLCACTFGFLRVHCKHVLYVCVRADTCNACICTATIEVTIASVIYNSEVSDFFINTNLIISGDANTLSSYGFD